MSTETTEKMVHCVACNASFEVSRSPMKPYKVTQYGILCNECYAEQCATVCMEFGCGSLHYGGYDGIQAAIEEMRKANRLWNSLVEIDNFSRLEYRRLTGDPVLDAKIEPLEAELEAINASTQNQKLIEKKRTVKLAPATAARKKAVLAELKTLRAERKTLVSAMAVSNAKSIGTLRTDTDAKIKAASEASGLLWTSRNPLLVKFKTASSKAKKESVMLKFHRFDGTGSLNVPFTNGVTLAELNREEEAGNLQIAATKMTEHPKEKRYKVRFIVQRVEGLPVWLTLPVVFHRPIPTDAVIRNACVVLTRVAGKPVFKLVLTIRTAKAKATVNTSAVGIDLGWRKTHSGIRVAYCVDSEGTSTELRLPVGVMQQFRQLDRLQGIIGDNFNAIKAQIASWVKGKELPEPLKESLAFVHVWKNPGKLVRALRVWEQNRVTDDGEVFTAAHAWCWGDSHIPGGAHSHGLTKPSTSDNGHFHLYQWAENLRDQLLRQRRELYRVFASDLAKRYGTVFMEEFDLREVAKTAETKGTPEKAEYDHEARYQRTKASVSELRQAIRNACASGGVKFALVGAMYTTHDCVNCGDTIKFDAAKAIRTPACPNCGSMFDQDYLAARNVLDRGLLPNGDTVKEQAEALAAG